MADAHNCILDDAPGQENRYLKLDAVQNQSVSKIPGSQLQGEERGKLRGDARWSRQKRTHLESEQLDGAGS